MVKKNNSKGYHSIITIPKAGHGRAGRVGDNIWSSVENTTSGWGQEIVALGSSGGWGAACGSCPDGGCHGRQVGWLLKSRQSTTKEEWTVRAREYPTPFSRAERGRWRGGQLDRDQRPARDRGYIKVASDACWGYSFSSSRYSRRELKAPTSSHNYPQLELVVLVPGYVYIYQLPSRRRWEIIHSILYKETELNLERNKSSSNLVKRSNVK